AVQDGNAQKITFTFSKAGEVSLRAFVVPAESYFSGWGPSDVPATPGASAQPSEGASEGASGEPSDGENSGEPTGEASGEPSGAANETGTATSGTSQGTGTVAGHGDPQLPRLQRPRVDACCR
ncbi:hypothetical protein ACFTXB_23985, partial [Streptomyces sp. NPDC057074]